MIFQPVFLYHAGDKMAKKKAQPPRRKRMNRNGRLQHVKDTKWIKNFEGKNIGKSYSKWFGVDRQCALYELEMLGYPLTDKDIKMALAIESEKMRKLKTKQKHEQKLLQEDMFFVDDDFFITDYSIDDEIEEDFENLTKDSRKYINDDLPF